MRPFSNGSEYMMWNDANCCRCKKYECESATEEEAGCRLAFNLDLGCITGDVPEDVCNEIGMTDGELNSRCANIEVIND